MREILFKAKRKNWRKLSKEEWWVEGYSVKYQPCASKDEWIYGIVPTYASALYIIEIDPETLCQYTGLKDKNGNRIWENDILHVVEKMGNDVYHNGNLVSSPRWINEFNFKVEFTPGGLMNTKRFANAPQIECEVIGNIFDNPELLEGESV